jgi:hypothetical protein
MVKYAETRALESRYGCDGRVGEPVAGRLLPEIEEFEGEPWTGVLERGLGIIGIPENEYWVGYVGEMGGEEGELGGLRDLFSASLSVGIDPCGIDNGGMGSTLLCLWRYTPSWGPWTFFRNIWTNTLNRLPAYQIVCE